MDVHTYLTSIYSYDYFGIILANPLFTQQLIVVIVNTTFLCANKKCLLFLFPFKNWLPSLISNSRMIHGRIVFALVQNKP
uniref:Ovule protein n=1 Tax=Heterorhabditis bacteriophora TaxID=37862 RepID=A0A1I7XSP9_HETBA